MSDITRWKVSGPATRLQPDANGPWVALVDYYRVTDRLIAERDEARVEVERLKEQVGALTVAVEQADEMKAHAEAAAAAEEAQTDRVMVERDAAQVEVERLKRMLPPTAHTGILNGPGEGSWSVFAGKVVEERDEAREEVERLNAEVKRLTHERDEAREKLARVQMQYIDDEFAKVTAKVINRHQCECDHAHQQVDRLQQAGADRPTDEDIWRQAFTATLQSAHLNRTKMADEVLAEYRKRWPR